MTAIHILDAKDDRNRRLWTQHRAKTPNGCHPSASYYRSIEITPDPIKVTWIELLSKKAMILT